jgi:hypothetical protein
VGATAFCRPAWLANRRACRELRMSDNFTLSDTVRADAPSVAVLLPVGLEAQRQ